MVDIEKHIQYWRDSAHEDFAVGGDLVGKGRVRHGLFFVHLALEKLLKAHVCKKTGDIAPRLHNLARLAEMAGLVLPPELSDVLADVGPYNLEGRYPESLTPPPDQVEAEAVLTRSREVFQWLTQRL